MKRFRQAKQTHNVNESDSDFKRSTKAGAEQERESSSLTNERNNFRKPGKGAISNIARLIYVPAAERARVKAKRRSGNGRFVKSDARGETSRAAADKLSNLSGHALPFMTLIDE